MAALLVLAALIVPWMSPVHPAPLADWLTDTLTLGGVALAALVPLSLRAEKPLTRASLLAWGMILVIVVQQVVNPPVYASQTWVPLGIFAAMVLLAGTVRDLICTPEARSRFLDWLAIALLLSAVVQAVLGFMQFTGLARLAGAWIAHVPGAPSSQVMGNICQRNVFAHMLALGVVSACWLYARERARARVIVPLVVFIATVVAWCGARLVLAYGAGLMLLGLWWWWRARTDAGVRRFCHAAWVSGAIVLAMQWGGVWVAEFLWEVFGIGQVPDSGFGRLFDVAPTQRRVSEWAKAFGAFTQHPVFGLGWGGLAHNSAYAEAYGHFSKVADNTLCLNAHNLVLQLLSETGLFGTLISLGGVLWCLWPCLRRASLESVFLLGLAMVTLTHSQFEYPLWYVTGLATFVVVLACAAPESVATSIFKPMARRFVGLLMSAVLMIHAFTGGQAFFAVVQAFGSSPDNWTPGLAARIDALRHHPLWSADAELVLSVHMVPWGEPQGDKRAVLERQWSYRPYGPILLKLAMLRAAQGDLHGAQEAIDLLAAGFPDMLEPFLDYSRANPDPAVEPVRTYLAEALARVKPSGKFERGR